MYTKILVPLDGSKRAEAILPHVEELAKHYGAEILLIQVIEPASLDVSIFDVPPSYQVKEVMEETQTAKAYLADLEEKLKAQGFPVKVHVHYGSIVKTILDIADQEEADLIALASHGRTGMGRLVYGSVASGILHRAQCPLLLIRAETEDEPAT
jgi:nucleotide-binding universal stress UspA family protein